MKALDLIARKADAALERATAFEESGDADHAARAVAEADACLADTENALMSLWQKLRGLRIRMTRLRACKRT